MWYALKWILFYVVIQFSIIFGFSFVYINNGNDPTLLGNYINDVRIYIVLILALIFIPLLIYKYKKLNIKEQKTNISKLILMTICLSATYNILAYYLDKYILLSNLYSNNNNIIVGIISTVLIAPFIEELMFRGVIYNNLKSKYNIKKAMLLTTILFCLSHFTLIQIIYTFIFGYILVYIYEKYQNIKYPIILHMISNLTTTIISLFIIKDYLMINIIILIVSTFTLFLIYDKVIKTKEV